MQVSAGMGDMVQETKAALELPGRAAGAPALNIDI